MSSMSTSLPPAPPSSPLSESRSSSNSKPQSPSSPPPKLSVSLILAVSGSSPYALSERASSAVYLRLRVALTPVSFWVHSGRAGCMERGGGRKSYEGFVYNLHHVTLVVLVVAQRQQDDVALVDPDLLAKLASDVAQSAGTVEALRLQTAVSKSSSA